VDAASGSSGRRSILRCALAGAVLLLIGACTPPGLPDPITPTGLTSVPTSPPAAGTVVIGLDGRAGRLTGFNPYAIADFSPAAQAAASLVLPSTFVVAADGSLTADPDVIDSAEVTTQDPFTVTYTVDRKASWSDGTPVAAEDFSYLREQLLTAPGTVDPAGYRLISDIRSRDAGKTVEVEFSEPFPDWRTLFSPLLPSHLVKDFPGGWGAAFNADIPVSANKYRMNSYDPITGQISLSRNDKYWGTPPQPATVRTSPVAIATAVTVLRPFMVCRRFIGTASSHLARYTENITDASGRSSGSKFPGSMSTGTPSQSRETGFSGSASGAKSQRGWMTATAWALAVKLSVPGMIESPTV
jgi:ABC-type transport system substrate-binding protein